MQFHTFDEEYLRRLAEGDAVVEDHFATYFGKLLSLKLRTRIRSPQLIEDIRQETLLRALQMLRKKGGVEGISQAVWRVRQPRSVITS